MYDNYSEIGAVCPYCGHLNKSEDSDYVLCDESIDEYCCDNCCKDFLCSADVTWSWTTKKMEDKNKLF